MIETVAQAITSFYTIPWNCLFFREKAQREEDERKALGDRLKSGRAVTASWRIMPLGLRSAKTAKTAETAKTAQRQDVKNQQKNKIEKKETEN